MSFLDLLRYVVFAVFAASAAVALGSWAVRTRRISPFSGLARLILRVTEPIIAPIERWQLKRGGNPHNAPWWLLVGSVVGGIVFITLAQWLSRQLWLTSLAVARGPRGILRLSVYYLGQLVLIALIIRVIGSWFGLFRHNRWMRPVYALTDWIVEPLRRIIPPLGFVDITPIVAWLLIQVLLGWLMRVL